MGLFKKGNVTAVGFKYYDTEDISNLKSLNIKNWLKAQICYMWVLLKVKESSKQNSFLLIRPSLFNYS